MKEIKMPSLGTTSKEIIITEWCKREGEQVARGDVLFRVETDKATMDVESYVAGFLKKIIVNDSESAQVGSVVAYIGDQDEAFRMEPESEAQISIHEKTVQPSDPSCTKGGRIPLLSKRVAEKLGVDVNKVRGTGPSGMVTKADVLACAKARTTNDSDAAMQSPLPDAGSFVPFNSIGRATAQGMASSNHEIPHVYYSIDICPQAIINARAAAKKAYSLNAMIIKAVAQAIREFPRAAAAFRPEGVELPVNISVGLAMDIDGDLVVPVVHGADRMDVYQIEGEIRSLAAKARAKRLLQSDLSGGVFTVTNLGGFGMDAFHAVIRYGESGILAVGRIREEPVLQGGAVVPGLRMNLGLSQDHRVVNGAYSSAFLTKIKYLLEGWTNGWGI